MKIIAQGLFGKLPVSDEYLLLGLPGWAVDSAWQLLDKIVTGVHRYVLAIPQRRSLLYGISWPSMDALGRNSTCSLVAVEKGRKGIPSDAWQHPWFQEADMKLGHCAGLAMQDLITLVTKWAGGMRLRSLQRTSWGKDIVHAVDGSSWQPL